MFQKIHRKREASSLPPSQTLDRIIEAVRTLRLPSPSLYYAFGQERATDLQTRIDGVDAALQQTKREADEAAVRLLSLDAPARAVFTPFTALTKAGNDGS